jgi:parallel beta-helix repeat protein
MDNYSEYDGGGIVCSGDSSPVIENNLITGNTAEELFGGGIKVFDSSPILRNNTIVGNAAHADGYGGGIYCTDTTVIVNCIIRNNTPDQISGTPAVTFSNIEGEYPGDGNMTADPLFVEGPLGQYYLSQVEAGQAPDGYFFNQAANSPCVDMGDPLSGHINGTTRTDSVPDRGRIDIGFHYPPYSWHDNRLKAPPGNHPEIP